MNKSIKFQFLKKFCSAFFIAVIMAISALPFSASASSLNNAALSPLSTQSAGLSGFGMSDHTYSQTFYIPVSGPTKSTGGITIKALNCPSDTVIAATIYRQDGSVLSLSVPNGLAYVQLTPGDNDYLNRYQFSNADAETYSIYFVSSNPVNILCWIYG